MPQRGEEEVQGLAVAQMVDQGYESNHGDQLVLSQVHEIECDLYVDEQCDHLIVEFHK